MTAAWDWSQTITHLLLNLEDWTSISLAFASVTRAGEVALTRRKNNSYFIDDCRTPLFYGTGAAVGLGSGVPALNKVDRTHYFTGRSDNFDPLQASTNPFDARFDPESIRVSNDGNSIFISDEYSPYVYEFDRSSGRTDSSIRVTE